jgi:molybdate transport system substrate-binding protein
MNFAAEINVAVASNFGIPMKNIVAEFEEKTGNIVNLSFGSSGRFAAQIINGAPFSAFFSADQSKPQALEEAGLVLDGSRFTYAIGRLVLWSSRGQFVDNNEERLITGNYDTLAFANPRVAPYGIAAQEVLQRLNVRKRRNHAWVNGENVAQTYQFIATQNVDLGFVSLSQIISDGDIKNGSSWLIPSSMYNPILQDAVILKSSESIEAARELMLFMRSSYVRNKIEEYGYFNP